VPWPDHPALMTRVHREPGDPPEEMQMPKLNPNGESAAGAEFGAGDKIRRDLGLVAWLCSADPRERVF
jgi:hypothetical protein